MKKFIFILTIIILLAFVTYYFVLASQDELQKEENNGIIQGESDSDENGIAEEAVPLGVISILNYDEETNSPIKGTEYTIISSETNDVIEIIITNEDGLASSSGLEYGSSYIVKQTNIRRPYLLNKDEITVEINEEQHQFSTQNIVPDFVKSYNNLEDGQVEISELYIPVPLIYQEPVLPNGCEITSLTSVLNFLGYDVSKEVMSDDYLPKQYFTRKDGELYGADPYLFYAGEPRDRQNGFFSYAPPIVEAANLYIEEFGGDFDPKDITGSSREEIIAQLEKGNPVVIWVTIDLKPVRLRHSWKIIGTGEPYIGPSNLHCVVINGFVDDKVHVMDPLEGQVIHDADVFFDSYVDLGSRAVIVEPK